MSTGDRTSLGPRLRSLLPAAKRHRERHSKGAAELSVVVVAASLVAGVFFGNGLSRTAVQLADGLTWIGDDPTGEVIQVNPATGRPELRVKVGEPGNDLDLAQYDGRLFVTNHTTGNLMSFDLTSILVSGQRRVTSGGAVHTLTHDGSVFLVDSDTSTITAVDPVSLDAIGKIWVSPAGLADAAIDDSGAVWALDDAGGLSELRWSERAQAFEEKSSRLVEQSGEGSVLVAHERGATVFGPDSGIVVQVGTGQDLSADAPKLSGELFAPESAPSDLVPVAAPDTGTVVIVSPDGVREVDVTSIECDSPAAPQVFREIVYVPCPGDSKVVQLDRDGVRAGPDIETPGSTAPELVLDDDNLIINNPGSEDGVVVHDDGSVSAIVRYDENVPTTDALGDGDAPAAAQELVEQILDHDPVVEEEDEPVELDPDSSTGPGGVPSGQPTGSPSGGPSGGPDGDHDGGPGLVCTHHCGPGPGQPDGGGSTGPSGGTTGGGTIDPSEAPALQLQKPKWVRASQVSEGQVQVTWSHSGPAANKFVVRIEGGADVAEVPGANRQAIVPIPPGQSVAFIVTAVSNTQQVDSLPSNSVSTSGRPSAPVNLSGDAHYEMTGTLQTYVVTVRWGAAEANGSPVTRYDVTISTPNGAQSTYTDGAGRTAQVSWSCDYSVDPSCPIGGDYTATVVASNDQGPGPAGTVSGTGPAQPAPPLPAANADIVDSATTDWSGRSEEGMGTTTLRLSPPPDWATFSGSCEWQHSGNRTGVVTGSIACDATRLTVTINNGVLRQPSDGKVNHSIVFTATNANGTVVSKRFSWTTEQRVLCQSCQIP